MSFSSRVAFRLVSSLPAVFSLVLFTSAANAEEEVVLTEEGGASKPSAKSSAKSAKPSQQPVVDDSAGVMVRPFQGPKSQTIQERVVSTLEAEGIILIPAGFEEGIKLGDAPGPYIEVARKNQIKAYLHGVTKMSKREWALTLKVRNARDGKPIGEARISHYSLPGLLKKIDQELMSKLDETLFKTSVPGSNAADSAAASKPAEDDGEEVSLTAEVGSSDPAFDSGPPEPKPKDDGQTKAPSPLDVNLGIGIFQRTLQYYKDVADSYEHKLQPHPLVAAALRIGAHWYPGAHGFSGPLANVGLYANYYQTVGGSNTVVGADGASNDFSTSLSEFNLGLRGRIPFRQFELGLNGGWGIHSLVMEGDNLELAGAERVDPGVVPDMTYTYFRFGPDVHFDVGAPIEVGLFYRLISLKDDDGFFAEDRWFPSAAGVGVDAYAKFGIELTDSIDLQVGGEIRYYGVKANSGSAEDNIDPTGNAYVPGTPGLNQAVAAGIADIYVGGFVMAEYVLPGVAR